MTKSVQNVGRQTTISATYDLLDKRFPQCQQNQVKCGASSRWPFHPNSALGSIETNHREDAPQCICLMLSTDFSILQFQLEVSKSSFQTMKGCLSSLDDPKLKILSINYQKFLDFAGFDTTIIIFGVTYLAWFNVSPFAFIRAGGVLGHGVPLSKCRYVPISQ